MDFDGVVSSTKAVVSLVGNGIDLTQKLRDLIKPGEKGGVDPAALELALDLQQKLIDTKVAQLALLDTLLNIKAEIAQSDRRLELQRDYEPFQTAGGAFVLALKTPEGRAKPVHYLCPQCAEKGIKTFLQPMGNGKRCHPCGVFFDFERPDDSVYIADVPRDFF